jgi:hypothetical protein
MSESKATGETSEDPYRSVIDRYCSVPCIRVRSITPLIGGV